MVLGSPASVRAWAEHEHARITQSALELVAAQGADTQDLLAALREASVAMTTSKGSQGSLSRLRACESTSFEEQVGPLDEPSLCHGFAWFPMLAGDHACNTAELERVVSTEIWAQAVVVAALATETRVRLAQLGPEKRQLAERDRIRREMDLALTEADADYLSRVSTTSAHHVPARKSEHETLSDFLTRVSANGSRLNASTLYAYYHTLALTAAALHRRESDPSLRRERARSMALLEGMALHFLEDSFSAGHLHGVIRSRAERLGTHDYHCVHGFVTEGWDGSALDLRGDLHMRVIDRGIVAEAVAESLLELAEGLKGTSCIEAAIDDPAAWGSLSPALSDERRKGEGLDVCYTEDADEDVQAVVAAASKGACSWPALRKSPKPVVEGSLEGRRRAAIGLGLLVLGEQYAVLPWRYSSRIESGSDVAAAVDPGLFGVGAGARMAIGVGVSAAGTFTIAADAAFFGALGGGLAIDPLRNEIHRELSISLRVPYYMLPLDGLIFLPLALSENPFGIRASRVAFEETPVPLIGAIFDLAGENVVSGRIAYGLNGHRLSLEILRDVAFRLVWTESLTVGRSLGPGWEIGTKLMRWRFVYDRDARAVSELSAYLGLSVGHRPSDIFFSIPGDPSAPIGVTHEGAYWQLTAGFEEMVQFLWAD